MAKSSEGSKFTRKSGNTKSKKRTTPSKKSKPTRDKSKGKKAEPFIVVQLLKREVLDTSVEFKLSKYTRTLLKTLDKTVVSGMISIDESDNKMKSLQNLVSNFNPYDLTGDTVEDELDEDFLAEEFNYSKTKTRVQVV